MKNILIIAYYTFREALARKIFIMFFGVSSFVLFLFIIIFSTANVEELTAMVQVGGDQPFNIVDKLVEAFRIMIIMPLFAGALFISIFSASSFIPNMLEKGNVDLVLSKPISRNEILLGKFLGGILVVLVNIAYLVAGLWVLIGFKFGIWDPGILLTILTITYAFAVLYSLIILIGVVSQSSVLAMIISYLIFFVFSPILAARDKITFLTENETLGKVLNVLYYIVPQTNDLGNLTGQIASGDVIRATQTIYVSLLFILVSLFLSAVIFNKKDY